MSDIIISLLVVSGIGALLALFLEVAHKYLADYGEVQININEQKDLTVEGGSPLLFSLGSQGVFIPSACGGRGTCAYCKVKVHDGGGPVLPTETPYLTAEEIQDNVRLSCQVKVRNDIHIEIPEELFNVKEFKMRVDKMTDVTPAIRHLQMTILDPPDGIHFKAGQYVQLEAPKFELTSGPEFRAFSIASSPAMTDGLELVITHAPDGVVAIYVHEHLKEGDEVVVRGPYGDFFLRDSDCDILFIATGSGMAPIRSLLHQLEEEKIRRKAMYFFGGRRPDDLFFQEQLKHWEETLYDFKFIPVLSRVSPEHKWEGEQGRVTNLIEKYIEEGRELDVYICGAPAMVESCLEELAKKGVPEERVYFDKFA